MPPHERMPHANDVEYLLYFIINMLCKIDATGEMNLFHEEIKRILGTDLPGLPLKSKTSVRRFEKSRLYRKKRYAGVS